MNDNKIIKENRRKSEHLIQHGFKNCLKCSHGVAESRLHKLKKFHIASFCWEKGLTFSTEATLKNRRRADIIVHDWAVIIEIFDSEGIKSLIQKQQDANLPVIAITCRQPKKNTMDMLQELHDTNGKASDFYNKKIWM